MKYNRIDGLVSIVVSNYNNENYILGCLDSILNQTYENIEIIVIDDNSTDNSVPKIKNWIIENKKNFKSDDYIKLLELPKNVGFAGSVTYGLFLARGEYIAMHDGDDKSHKDRIKKQVDFLNNNKGVNVVGTNYASFNNDDPTPKTEVTDIEFGVDKIKDKYSSGLNCVCHGSLLIKGTVFDSVGGLSRKLEGAEDYEFITKLLPFGIDNINEELYYYRVHENQRSKLYYDTNKFSMEETDLKVLMVLDSLNIGGTETHVYSLIKEFLDRDIKVCLLADHGPYSSEFLKLGCTIYNIDFPLYVIEDVATANRYKNKIKQIILAENINIIHAHQSPSGALCVDIGKELNIPCIFTVHGLYYYDILHDRLNLSDSVISVSQPTYDWLLEYNVSSTVIPNSLDFDNYVTKTPDLSIKEELGIDKDAFTIVYCSRIAWSKTRVAENLLRVCRDLVRIENLNLHLIIVGDGPDFNQLVGIANRTNALLGKECIHLVGGKTNVVDYYLNADCIVGTGRVAIEAFACKKPVIASGNNGYFGILNNENIESAWRVYFGDHKSIKSNNASFLYNDIKYVYENKNDLDIYTESCYDWAKSFFDIRTNIDKLINIYMNSLKNIQ
ncbi:glycosyltransferase [Paraclostridium ghonii]|uniref:glycosyltransferase n=1 Tax=Paraclostridium ghonii TaxID=29358 RepID=UPI00202CD407|nr:glycosyltransferase [Paeniclostridium ghonii]MCM0166383.1 glycosyltransferase [Paeniclostridium ghonii]